MELMALSDIAKHTGIPAPTARRYASLFKDYLSGRRLGRMTRYPEQSLAVFQRIGELYADGRITSCDVTASSGHADLDAETCKLIQRRGRFNPGKDRAGNPVGGSYSNRIRWQIPR